MNFKIRTENMINKRPATAAIIMSRPAPTPLGSPEDIKTRTEPITIRTSAIPPARPIAMERNWVENAPISVEIFPKAVGQVLSGLSHGFRPGGPVPDPGPAGPHEPRPSLPSGL